ncbi:MAG: hypothetical protein ABIP53_01260 [Candidatus Limnocylindrales bacterium]
MMRGVLFASLAVLGLLISGCTSVPPGATTFLIPTFAPGATLPPLPPPPSRAPLFSFDLPDVSFAPLPTFAPLPPTATPLIQGTREEPLALGTEVVVGDWRVTVESVNTDAWAVVHAENQFNAPPAEGRHLVLFAVSATYQGTDTGTAWLDLSWKVVGSDGNTFGTGTDDHCGVIPDSLFDQGEQFPGSTVEGNGCISAEADQLDGAVLTVESLLAFGDVPAYFALE